MSIPYTVLALPTAGQPSATLCTAKKGCSWGSYFETETPFTVWPFVPESGCSLRGASERDGQMPPAADELHFELHRPPFQR